MVNERNMKLVTKTNARTNSPEKVLPSNTSASMRIHCGDDSPVTKAPVSNIDIERDEYDGRKSTAKSTWTAGTPGSSGLSRSSSKSMESVRAYMDVMSPEEQVIQIVTIISKGTGSKSKRMEFTKKLELFQVSISINKILILFLGETKHPHG